MDAELRRLEEQRSGARNWRRWGPYLAERQWGTVREDYSPGGNAWDDLSHEQATSRAYRWGEDGLAGLCDDRGRLCLALALWNGRDPILKERLFGLTNSQGNHGEDVKEVYHYLDATPSHAYLHYLYKYPQSEFPYRRLVEENARRGRFEPEFELIETGVFDDDRYFDVFIEYAKASPNDLLMRVTAHNRGPERARLHILPHLWFRNTWSWTHDSPRPTLRLETPGRIVAEHPTLRTFHLAFEPGLAALFCENDTNVRRLYGRADAPGPFKDAIHELVVHERAEAVNPDDRGTKAALHDHGEIEPGGARVVRLRLSRNEPVDPFADFDAIFERRVEEADAFYAGLQRGLDDEDARRVHRQALAGMIWSKQLYLYDVTDWLRGDPAQPAPPPERRHVRNGDWTHVNTADVLSMPDTWEYPWFAAWDLAFHAIPLARLDPDFAKEQLILLTREWYMHPNGQLPAYEWNFCDANPPVHAWAAWKVFEIDRQARGAGDLDFLKRILHKLLLNFTWWVNRKDAQGRNVFQGGFLGLDNIGVFDRSRPLPTGGYINQADGTAWMAMYCLNLMRIALELGQHDHVYEDLATKFFEHFLYIAEAMTRIGGNGTSGVGLWDEHDEFYHDVLILPDGGMVTLRIRSMVGLIPLFAVEVLEPELLERVPEFARRLDWFLRYRPDLASLVSHWDVEGKGQRRLLSLLRGRRMKRLLRRMLDESEFLSPHGIRALSKHHERHPYTFPCDHLGNRLAVSYVPGDSDSAMFGGNSNWRGPVWMPVNYLIVESLRGFHRYYGDEFRVECPTGSGRFTSIAGVADELARRLQSLFLRGRDGRRPAFGPCSKFQDDPYFRDNLLFHEFFHGDDGRGLGASHQTGWTGLIANLFEPS